MWAGSRLRVAELSGACRSVLEGGERQAPAGVRCEAARALGRLGPRLSELERRGAAGALRKALGDPEVAVRAAAAEALAQVAPEQAAEWALEVRPFDAVALGPVGGALRGTEPLTATRLASSEARRLALPRLIAQRSLEPLQPLAAKGEDKVREDVLAALGRMGSEAAAELLKGLALDKQQPEALRKAAWRAHKRARRALERARQEGSAS
jgi:ParB family chromosome partitioning protein